MNNYNIRDILADLNIKYEMKGLKTSPFSQIKPILEADKDSLAFVDANRNDKVYLIENSRAELVICDSEIDLDKWTAKKSFIIVKNPKLTIARIAKHIYSYSFEYGIHPSSTISPKAKIHKNTYIGPNSYIGECEIDEGTIIHGNCFIYDGKIKIGKNVTIFAGCIIGATGFSFIRDENEKLVNIPHLGGVIIEDNVELQALSNVDRGAFGNTIIKNGTKIDTMCHIGHNTKIGTDNSIMGVTLICGSSTIGNNCTIGARTTILDGITIGNNIFSGLGSLVVKSYDNDSKIMGAPAKPINEYKKMMQNINLLSKNHEINK